MSALESLLLATDLLVVESQTLPLDVINGDTAPDMSEDQDMVLSAKNIDFWKLFWKIGLKNSLPIWACDVAAYIEVTLGMASGYPDAVPVGCPSGAEAFLDTGK